MDLGLHIPAEEALGPNLLLTRAQLGLGLGHPIAEASVLLGVTPQALRRNLMRHRLNIEAYEEGRFQQRAPPL